MKLVVDTNIIMSAMIRDSTTRRILLFPQLDLYAPEHIITELKRYGAVIISKGGYNEDALESILSMLISNIDIIPENIFHDHLFDAKELIGSIDMNDIPFLALALHIDCDGIWTHDKHFIQQERVLVWTTKDLLEHLSV
jgi:predicted nucleic acid-binding protein